VQIAELDVFEDQQKYVTSVPPFPTIKASKMAKTLLLSGKLNK
jgi:hypothetical protein